METTGPMAPVNPEGIEAGDLLWTHWGPARAGTVDNERGVLAFRTPGETLWSVNCAIRMVRLIKKAGEPEIDAVEQMMRAAHEMGKEVQEGAPE